MAACIVLSLSHFLSSKSVTLCHTVPHCAPLPDGLVSTSVVIKGMKSDKVDCFVLERFSIECRKTKIKVITLANLKGRRQSGKPIKTRSNYT